jgi:3-oxoacyl-[acyl-carrier protein] reductase
VACCRPISTAWQKSKFSSGFPPIFSSTHFLSESFHFDDYLTIENSSTEEGFMSELKGKVAVVTGASKGIGAGIAKGLAEAGASVVVNYASSKEGADRVVAEIKSKGGKAVAIQGDVSKSADIKRLFAETKKAFGTLDVLVNNAGVFQFEPLEAVTETEFHRQFNTNVLGTILTTQEAARYFGPNGGSVINIGSVAGQNPMPASVVYSATKSAIDQITRVLAMELGPRKIRVNSINPGGVETEGTQSAGILGSDFEKQMVARTSLGRLGQPDDIAPIAVFLASPASQWVTGEVLAVSGGFR